LTFVIVEGLKLALIGESLRIRSFRGERGHYAAVPSTVGMNEIPRGAALTTLRTLVRAREMPPRRSAGENSADRVRPGTSRETD